MSFIGGLALLFIGLKLAGFITWSWWLVLIPLYPLFAVLAFALFALVMSFVAAILK